jgi:AcrR family transcriptional regulator
MEKLSKKQRTFKLLAHTARVLFEKNGIEDVTFDDIAEHANVCRTTVFNHFSSGKELLEALCDVEIKELLKHCENSTLKGLDLIKSLFGKLIDDTCSYPVLTAKLSAMYFTQKGMVEGAATLEKIVIENLLRKNENQNLPVLEKMSAQEAATAIFGLYYGLCAHNHINDKAFEPSAVKESFFNMMEKILF